MPFIVLEGPDGAGTTKHSAILADRLTRKGREVVLTAEPSDGSIGTFIRSLLKPPTGARAMPIPSPQALQLLFCADRADHVDRIIAPALATGKTVICDRYSLSTIVYGSAQGLDVEWLDAINAAFPQPDRIILLLPPYSVCSERIGRRATHDLFEEDSFAKIVYDGYREIEDPLMPVIDTEGKVEEVAEQVWRAGVEK